MRFTMFTCLHVVEPEFFMENGHVTTDQPAQLAKG